mmetsp:Transcript_14830/g.30045  ORF Transcript_14830/g.30045 Transcript_14830/m.30045 type:complete len:292 (+) Transcript_14830:58-933(+)
MGQTQTVYLPPWEPTTETEKERADEFRTAIQELRNHSANFLNPHSSHTDSDFSFDWTEHRPFAEAAYTGDARLGRLIPRLVPKHVSEEDFWRNYFSHVFAVKRSFAQIPIPALPNGAVHATSASTAEPPVPTVTPVSYPEKFHLAAKYATEGPSLPNLSDADRVLLHALYQQASIGPCNTARPGMWDSAEDKAKYEAWKKLGTMSRSEAMHLYVQAIEVFDTQWMQWDGFRDALPTRQPDAAAAATITRCTHAINELRLGLAELPPGQLVAVRAECNALLAALDAHGVPKS